MIVTEAQLASLAASLIPDWRALTGKECALLGEKADSKLIASTRALIEAGVDPLGEMFSQIRSANLRRQNGATYTPQIIVDSMVRWAASQSTPPARVVDAGSGSGRYTVAAARQFPAASLLAVEIDPLAVLMLRANASVLGFSDRLTVRLIDYRELTLPAINGPTLFIGNPPYVRHHEIPEYWKMWLAEESSNHGFRASKLAGLHVHFFLKTRLLGKYGDYGSFITAAEWLDVNYGNVLRRMLADGLGGTSVHLIDPKAMPFADALATGAITCFRVGQRPDHFKMHSVANLQELSCLEQGRLVSWNDLADSHKWSPLINALPESPAGYVQLGELFRVHRGVVTGGNEVFLEGAYSGAIPERFMVPAITRAKDLISAGAQLTKSYAKNLRRIISLPANTLGLNPSENVQIEAFKKWAKGRGVDQSWTARSRSAWWSVKLREPAAILCTYMARRAPAFVLNTAGVPHINIAHGLYPRVPMTTADLKAYVAYLSSNVRTSEGRTYAGGLTKFEPREIERILVPCLKRIHARSNEMEPRTAYC